MIISRYNSEISQNWKNDLLINSSHFPLKAATIWGVGLTEQMNFWGGFCHLRAVSQLVLSRQRLLLKLGLVRLGELIYTALPDDTRALRGKSLSAEQSNEAVTADL